MHAIRIATPVQVSTIAVENVKGCCSVGISVAKSVMVIQSANPVATNARRLASILHVAIFVDKSKCKSVIRLQI